MARNRRFASSATEVVIAAIVLVILTAAIVPRFVAKPAVVNDSLLRLNLHKIRTQIERYKTDHIGKAPTMANFCDQLTGPTNSAGATAGGKLPFGPYFEHQIPMNPFNGSSSVTPVATPGKPPIAAVPSDAGWQYDETTGRIYPNDPEYFAR